MTRRVFLWLCSLLSAGFSLGLRSRSERVVNVLDGNAHHIAVSRDSQGIIHQYVDSCEVDRIEGVTVDLGGAEWATWSLRVQRSDRATRAADLRVWERPW